MSSPIAAIQAALTTLATAVQAQNQAVTNATALFAQSDVAAIVEQLGNLTASLTASTAALEAVLSPPISAVPVAAPAPAPSAPLPGQTSTT
jgi:ethanolamine utilization protein EutA (predicted chaperonin)